MKNKSLILVFIVVFLCSCASTKYIEVPIEKTKIEYKHSIDSIYLHDSIYTSITQRGETIFVDRYKYKIKEIHRIDTVHKIDSIPKVITITKVKEVTTNKLYFWQKGLMYIGGVGLLVLLVFLIRKFKAWKLLF